MKLVDYVHEPLRRGLCVKIQGTLSLSSIEIIETLGQVRNSYYQKYYETQKTNQSFLVWHGKNSYSFSPNLIIDDIRQGELISGG